MSKSTERKPTPEPSHAKTRRNRYQFPAPSPPTIENMQWYVGYAGSALGDDNPLPLATEIHVARFGAAVEEAQRAKAVNAILTIARAELAKTEGPKRILCLLRRFELFHRKDLTAPEAKSQEPTPSLEPEQSPEAKPKTQPQTQDEIIRVLKQQLNQLQRNKPTPQQIMWEFLTIAGLRILTANNPVAELNRFLGKRPPADNYRRDTAIAADTQKRIDAGSSIENACKAIAADAPLSWEAVRKIYYAWKNASIFTVSLDPGDEKLQELMKWLRNAQPTGAIQRQACEWLIQYDQRKRRPHPRG